MLCLLGFIYGDGWATALVFGVMILPGRSRLQFDADDCSEVVVVCCDSFRGHCYFFVAHFAPAWMCEFGPVHDNDFDSLVGCNPARYWAEWLSRMHTPSALPYVGLWVCGNASRFCLEVDSGLGPTCNIPNKDQYWSPNKHNLVSNPHKVHQIDRQQPQVHAPVEQTAPTSGASGIVEELSSHQALTELAKGIFAGSSQGSHTDPIVGCCQEPARKVEPVYALVQTPSDCSSLLPILDPKNCRHQLLLDS
ncbi:hypothetical protein Nepgr_033724 [Nepenthes gracilis]|uniref:Uncharacterized protein n=1 Tax=Nepenthes gracilis TaxID=150966 RepID=A0AAD3TKY7_NEPGR|nr:hypothetical protein Nepgr_033724 [Nepenthes gracilis]